MLTASTHSRACCTVMVVMSPLSTIRAGYPLIHRYKSRVLSVTHRVVVSAVVCVHAKCAHDIDY